MKISYAQNYEDALLSRAFAGQDTGFYVDVGAAHPVLDSVTHYFYERGWQGINIEPVRESFKLLQKARTRDTNLNVAVSNTYGEATFYEIGGTESWCTLSSLEAQIADENVAAHRPVVSRKIPLVTLNSIFEGYVTGTIDFLKIDVEGHEKQVLEGCDFRRFRPRIVIVEATRPNSKETSFEEWQPLLAESGYIFAYFDGLNRYYIRNEDEPLAAAFATPISVLDGFTRHSENCLRLRVIELESNLALIRRVADKMGVTSLLRLLRAIKKKF